MFRGTCPSRVDKKGRFKLPADFKREVDERYSGKFYITSYNGQSIELYPIEEWEKVQAKIVSEQGFDAREFPADYGQNMLKYGQLVEMDSQGRLSFPQSLPQSVRETIGTSSEVVVIGKLAHLEVRRLDAFLEEISENRT